MTDKRAFAEEIAAGTWLQNPVTGELALMNIGPADTSGQMVDADLWLRPGAAVAQAHVHDALVERFEVLSGTVGFVLGGIRRTADPGSEAVVIPAGVVHDWWNEGPGPAHVRVTVQASDDAVGRPAARFVSVIEVLWSLGALDQTNAKGMPDPLWLAAIAREYQDAIRFVRPPAPIQRGVFGPLAALARGTGRDPLAPELHGRAAPCVVPTEDGERLSRVMMSSVSSHEPTGLFERAVTGAR